VSSQLLLAPHPPLSPNKEKENRGKKIIKVENVIIEGSFVGSDYL